MMVRQLHAIQREYAKAPDCRNRANAHLKSRELDAVGPTQRRLVRRVARVLPLEVETAWLASGRRVRLTFAVGFW